MRCALLLTVVGLLAACPRGDKSQPDVVARVQGQPIYAHQVERELVRYEFKRNAPPARVALATSVLDKLVTERLLLIEADRAKVEVGKEEVAEELERVTRGYRGRDLQQILDHNFMTPGLLRDRVRDRLRIERLLNSAVREVPPADEVELQHYYTTNLIRFQVPEQVRARQILVRTREEAEQLRERARRKEPFDELARDHSLAPEAEKGGDLGFFGRGVMPPIFDDICFSIEPGTISDVVASDYGFHLFLVVEKRAAEVRSFEEARADIARELADDRRREAVGLYLAELRERAKVVRHLDVLTRLAGKKEEEKSE